MPPSPQKLPDMAEWAIAIIRKLVIARRYRGLTWDAAIGDVAPGLGISTWRTHSLYYRYRSVRPVLWSEWNRLRLRGALMLRAEAAYLRKWADQLDAEADLLESQQSQYGAGACSPSAGADGARDATD